MTREDQFREVAKNYITEDVKVLADRLGLKVAQVTSMANTLRKKGVAIPHKPGHIKTLFTAEFVEELNKLV